MTEIWLPSRQANTSRAERDQAVKPARVAVSTTQPDATTVAPANGVWRAR